VLLVSKRTSKDTPPDPRLQQHKKRALTVLPLRRPAGVESPSGIQPFLTDLAAMLAADVLRDRERPKPRLRLRHRPVERIKPEFVLRRAST